MAFENFIVSVKDDDLVSYSTSPMFQLGARYAKNGNQWAYVYNGGNSTIPTGDYCVLQASGGSYTSGYTVTVTNASLAGWLAGVAQSTIPTGNYGFVLYNGVGLIAPDSGSVSQAAGVDLALGTDGGFIAAGATFATAMRFGFTLNSFVTTVGTSKARIFNSIFGG